MTPMFALSLTPESAAPYILAVLMVAAGIALVRLVKGPSVGDRVVAIEVIGAIVASAIVIAALSSEQAVLIDVALLFALVSFLGSLGFARFVAKGARGG